MARTQAERAAAYRSRRVSGLDAVLIDVDRQTVLSSGLMTADEYDDPAERRRILSEWLDGVLQTQMFVVTL